MLLSQAEFINFADRAVLESDGFAVDLETTSLSSKTGRAFLIGVSRNVSSGHENVSCFLTDDGLARNALFTLLGHKQRWYAAHNAKFEMSFFKDQFDVEIVGRVWCTEVMDRVLFNNHRSYSLQNCAKRRNLTKHEPMLKWLADNDHAYHKAPLDLIVPYVEQDANLSRILRNEQAETFKQWDEGPHPIKNVVLLEMQCTKDLFDMEMTGLTVNVPYCVEALAYEQGRIKEAADEFRKLTGVDLTDSRKCLAPIFDAQGIHYGETAKHNPSFDYDSLRPSRNHPIVAALFKHRDAVKRASTYWENFIRLQHQGKIHPSIRQTGAATFRMSVVDPACQTWPKDEEEMNVENQNPFPVRRAFLPSDADHEICSFDWQQMELRLMADEADERGMIDAFKQGHDFHQATADLAGVKRSIAKNGRFAKLYGAGVNRLATTLEVDIPTARRVSNVIDDTSPRITSYSQGLIRYAKSAPYGINWLGRRYYFDPGVEYRYPNYRIQGGCSEILKIAIRRVREFLQEKAPRSKLILPIHDELMIDLHKQDRWILPEIKAIMLGAYESKKNLDMDVSCGIGPNFHDLEEVSL
jgi:DNA polymerase I-like protein with 3'-5' exonuclease and polymerase domains